MHIRRAIILAAGDGSRLGGLTADRPAPLLQVGGRTLIDWQIGALAAVGVDDITLVVGHQAAHLREHLGRRVTFVENERYRHTGSLYSLWLAGDRLRDGAFVLNADGVFAPSLLDRLKWHPAPDALLFDSSRRFGVEEMKVRLAGAYVVSMSKELRHDLVAGENVGLLKFGREGGTRLARTLDDLVTAGDVNAWVPQAVTALAHRWPVVAVDTGGLLWADVDRPEDLYAAERVVAASRGAFVPSPRESAADRAGRAPGPAVTRDEPVRRGAVKRPARTRSQSHPV